MKRLLIILLILQSTAYSQTEEQSSDAAFLSATKKWFDAWKLVSHDIYGVEKVRPVEFVFFDAKYVYSTSNTTIEKGTIVNGNNLINLKFVWKRTLHNGNITLPDKSVAPVSLMSFASEIPNENKSFFVMPLPSFWEQAGVKSKEFGLENLVTGVFLHEFSHSQQMQNFGKKIASFEGQADFGIEFSDDIVQNLFGKDTAYLELYNKEVGLFYASADGNAVDKNSLNEALGQMKQRQSQFFTGKYQSLTQIDNLFLTMEGLGQYSIYIWMIHPKGGNIDKAVTIEGVRRGRKWWSQDEGFGLFLVLDKLSKNKKWAKDMFGESTQDVISLINELNTRASANWRSK